ncbi:MAG: DUF1592 domain-containing protein [Pirellulaceae bacterium]|nr:DUF1592 domain-containing protein [Pirellulaceae bacterium]
MNGARACVVFVILTLSSIRVFAESDRRVTVPDEHRDFLKMHCVKCHNADKSEGEARLDDISFEIADIETAERWQKILNALNAGEMPPEDSKQPTEIEKTRFLDNLSQTMVSARRKLGDQGGVITMRRLNRREYENTIRDLLGVSVNVKSLPSDVGAGGFDTVGKSLFFSSDQFEQYLAIARLALDEAMVMGRKPELRHEHRECEETATPSLKKSLANLQKQQNNGTKAIETGDSTKYGFPDLARAKFQKDQAEIRIPIHELVLDHPLTESGALLTLSTGYSRDLTLIPKDAAPGNYLLRVRAGTLGGVPSNRQFMEVGCIVDGETAQGEMTVLSCYQVTGTSEDPQTIEIPITVTKSGSRNFVIRERQHNDRKAVQTMFFRERAANGVGPALSLWLDWVEWEGPVVDRWPPEATVKLFCAAAHAKLDDTNAREIVARFATRAFRGKEVKESFLDKLMEIFHRQRKAGASLESALREPLAVVLASPSFLYIVEPTTTQETRALSPVELANRLSYFLWSAPPDDALMDLAESGELMKSDVLTRQVDRMMASPKAWSFVEGFVSQWLHMERLDFFQFSPMLYPGFDHSARLAARDEVFHTFHTVLREDLSLATLLKADFVVVNDLLADYYGLEGVRGNQFCKVALEPGSVRGGLLGMAAILAMGSDGERSSPVERGAFVMRRLLNAAPPPAPANVPQLSRLEGEILPARELLAAHMEEAQCAQCHRKIDPIGYGLENFNAAGLWRAEEVISVGKVKKQARGQGETEHFPIDPSGQLPDGTKFDDYQGLRQAVAGRTENFARGLTEALLEYALGRPFGFTDEELANDILASARSREYSLREIVHSIIRSQPFLSK